MLLSEEELKLVKDGRKRALWLPVERGSMGQRRACSLKTETVYSLQSRLFLKGVKVTVTNPPLLTTLGLMSDTDAARQGYRLLSQARRAWESSYGPWRSDREVWSVEFVLGDLTWAYEKHAERYLRSKMGGKHPRAYTTNPGEAVGGVRNASLHSVPHEDQVRYASEAAARRAAEAQRALRQLLKGVEKAVDAIMAHRGDLSDEVIKELGYLERRANGLREKVG